MLHFVFFSIGSNNLNALWNSFIHKLLRISIEYTRNETFSCEGTKALIIFGFLSAAETYLKNGELRFGFSVQMKGSWH